MGEIVKYNQPCPDCGSSDALAVYTDGTFCYSCHKGTKDVSDGMPKEPKQSKKARKEVIPPFDKEFIRLDARNIDKKTCEKYGYFITTHEGRTVQRTAFYRGDEFLGYKDKWMQDGKKTFKWINRDKSVGFFGQHLFPAGSSKRIYVTEGELDAMSLAQVYSLRYPVVSLPDGATSAEKVIKEEYAYLTSFDEVYLCFDNDQPGQEAVKKAADLLPFGKVFIMQIPHPHKDLNDMLMAGEEQEIKAVVARAKSYKPDNIYTPSDIKEQVYNYREEAKALEGYSLPYPRLNEALHGIDKGEVVILAGGTGVGKTTILADIAEHLERTQGCKIGGVFLEDKNNARTVLHFVEKKAGLQYYRLLEADDKTFKAAVDEVLQNDRYVFYDNQGFIDADQVLNAIRYMGKVCGCDFVFLDHISILTSGDIVNDERKRIDYICTGLQSIAKACKIGIVAAIHLSKSGGKAEEGGKIAIQDIRGSLSPSQLGACVLSVERDIQKHGSPLRFRIIKNRHGGTGGEMDEVIYNKETGRLDLYNEEEIDEDVEGEF